MINLPTRVVLHMLIFGCLCGEILNGAPSRKFSHLSVADGLSQNSVWCILRDTQGFLWFATDDGLNKFDGYQFYRYSHRFNDSTSLSATPARSLIQDRQGMIWVGTSSDLNVYDPVTDKIRVFNLGSAENDIRRVKGITALAEDATGSIWVGTYSMGLFRLSLDRKKITHFTNDMQNPASISANSIQSLFVDKKGVVWIGTNGAGISRYDATSDTFFSYKPDTTRKGALRTGFITTFFEDSNNRLWVGTKLDGMLLFDRANGLCTYTIQPVARKVSGLDTMSVLAIAEDINGRILYGTYGGGVRVYLPGSGVVESWKNDIRDPNTIASDYILSLYRDQSGCIWIGTETNGISKFDPESEHFRTYRNEMPRTRMFTGNDVRSIYKDKRGLLWIGTTKGMNIFNPATEVCKQYRSDGRPTTSTSDDYISVIFEDSRGTMWIGTRNGIMLFNRRSKSFTRLKGGRDIPPAIAGAYIRAILEDGNGVLWIGTSQGLFSFDRRAQQFKKFMHSNSNPASISSNNVRSMCQDRSGTIWVGTFEGGLNRLDTATETFTCYMRDPNNPHSISSDLASPFVEDRDGNLWVGTRGGGVNKLNPRTGEFSILTVEDGLLNNTIFGIRIDERGRVWITTIQGISCYDPVTRTFKNYSVASGLQGNEYNLNSCYRDADGTMYFGGMNGFNFFHPDSIRDNTFIPPVYVTSISIFNKPVRLDTSMMLKRHIVLAYNENFVSFDFVALNYRKPQLNQYKYILEGVDKEWVASGTTRKASYTNLQPGQYVFRVMGSNNDGVWNTAGISISIVVTPPFWRTWWAYLFYTAMVVTFVAAGNKLMQRRQKKTLLLEQQKYEAEIVREKNVVLKEANDEILRQQEILKERNAQIESANNALEHGIEERDALLSELKTAMDNVKTLGGLIPICSSCKKIRDDAGYWNILETYLTKHSDAQFSHGICPDCAQKLYPAYTRKPKQSMDGQA